MEGTMARVTISPKFQVVIPKQVRDSLGLRPGEQVEIFEYDGRIEFVPIRSIKTLRGSLRGMDRHIEREEDRV
jgi:AbrB family looped-hinge helix DNA binding protein